MTTDTETITIPEHLLEVLETEYQVDEQWRAEAAAITGMLSGDEQEPPNCKTKPWNSAAVYLLFNGAEGFKKWISKFPPRLNMALSAAISVALYELEAHREQRKEHVRYVEDSNRITTEDYIAALEGLGYTFRMNELDDSVEVNKKPITDALAAKIRAQMRDLGFNRVNIMEDAYTAHAYDNSYHPVRGYLAGLSYDGGQYINALASHFIDKYDRFDLWLKRWLIGAVARAYEHCQNRMLVLDGHQGIGKSYFAAWLCPINQYFVAGPINPGNKDDWIRLMRTWIWEVAELGSTTRKADREALKHFLSSELVTVRMPYGHHDLKKPALSSFIGTVNNDAGILSDPTGSRRFFIAHLQHIDFSYTDIDINDVWAEAQALYLAGEPWTLSIDEQRRAQEINDEYEIEDPLEDLIFRYYDHTENPLHFTPTIDILDDLHAAGWRLKSPRAESMAVASVCKKLGIESDRPSINGKRVHGYTGLKRCLP